jgi:hypothetical protein
MNRRDRYRGCLLGLATGDALGAPVEGAPRGSFAPLTDMVGLGPYGLPRGTWTDDTSLALCLGESLVEMGGFDPADQMRRYLRWLDEGYMSCATAGFGIGFTTMDALEAFRETGDPSKVSVMAFQNGWCTGSRSQCVTAREAVEGLEEMVDYREVDASDPEALRSWGISDGLYVEGEPYRPYEPPCTCDALRQDLLELAKNGRGGGGGAAV